MRPVGTLLVVALVLIGCGSATPAPSPAADLQLAADRYAIHQIEAEFHKAASLKDVDLMVSLFAENATMTIGGDQTYTGRDEIRTFWATKAGPFKPENTWVSETPAYKIRVNVNGDKGSLYFECHYVDVKTRTVVSAVAAEQSVAKVGGRWLITTFTASALSELVP